MKPLTEITVEKAEKGVEMNIVNPYTGEETDAFVTVYGADSDVVKNALAKLRKALDDERMSDQLKENKLIETLDKCIISYRNIEFKGEPVGREGEHNLKWFLRSYPKIAEQILSFISDGTNFLPESESNS